MPDVAAIAAQLKFTTSIDDVRANTATVRAALQACIEEQKALRGLLEACYAMCQHKRTTSYSDPRDRGWTCNDCGKTV